NLAATVIRGQWAESIDALQGAGGRDIERRHSAGLLHLHIEGMAIAGYVERDVDALRGGDLGIDLVLQPIFRYFALNDLDVPSEFCAKVSAAAGDAEAALRAPGAKTAIRSADRAAFAERDLIGLFLRSGLRLFFRGSGSLLRLDLSIFPLNIDRVGFFL